MNKYILALVLIFGLQSSLYALQVCVDITDVTLDQDVIVAGMLREHPMPQVNNDNGTPGTTIALREDDFDDGTATPLTDKYNIVQWARVIWRNHIRTRWHSKEIKRTEAPAVTVPTLPKELVSASAINTPIPSIPTSTCIVAPDS